MNGDQGKKKRKAVGRHMHGIGRKREAVGDETANDLGDRVKAGQDEGDPQLGNGVSLTSPSS